MLKTVHNLIPGFTSRGWVFLLLALLLVPTGAKADLTAGLVGHWAFDEESGTTALDSSSNGNAGTLTNGPVRSTGAAVGSGALSFDGINDYVTIPDSASLSSLEGSNQATISYWIKRNSTATMGVVSRIDSGRIFTIYSDANFSVRVEWRFGGSGTGGTTLDHAGVSSSLIPVGTWHHVVIIYNNPTSYVYVDGQLISIRTGTGGALNTDVSGPLLLGKYSSLYLNGSIDDVRIYNRALTVDEIGTLCGQAVGGCPAAPTTLTIPTTPTTPTTPSAPTSTVPSVPTTYSVKQDGTGNYTTIQACADVAKAGDTCLVYPGTYSEHVFTKSGGSDQSQRITFKANGTVTMQGFGINHPYITVDGFDITGFNPVPNFEHIDVTVGGNYCQIINNVIRDGGPGVGGINFALSGDFTAASNCLVRNNTLRNLNHTFINTNGANHIFENNVLEHLNSRDFLYVFGHGHVFRKNIFRDGNVITGVGNHPDWAQTFGNNGVDSYDMLFESNWIENLQGDTQLGQLEGGGGDKGIVFNIYDWVFRNNVIISVSGNMNHSVPGTRWVNNTFYRMAYSQNGINIYATLGRGAGSRMTLLNNVFVAGGSNPNLNNDFRGYYSLSGALLSSEVTRAFATAGNDSVALAIGFDLTAKGYLVNPNGQLTTKAKALTDISQFVIGDAYASYKPAVYDLLMRTAELDKTMRETTLIDYNFVSGAGPYYFPKTRSDCSDGIFSMFNFCEAHGINGGNPQFQNESDPDGPDNIPFTFDDGLKPLPSSPLCAKGKEAMDIGAYSCDPTKVFSETVLNDAGDVSGDGRVTMYDAAMILRYTMGANLTDVQKQRADINGDAVVNTADLMAIARKALGL
jgi:hypothetical protein